VKKNNNGLCGDWSCSDMLFAGVSVCVRLSAWMTEREKKEKQCMLVAKTQNFSKTYFALQEKKK
jgi:hypothetical protein